MADKSRDEKVEAILDTMDDWDQETLIQWAKDTRRDLLAKETDEQIDTEYRTEVLGEG